jgi:tetratricopeptide (TPR) repeat protein
MFQPATALFHFNLGLAQDALGRLDEAVLSYRQAARLDPSYTKAFINLGICLGRSGKLDDAVASYREAVRSEPDHVEARLALGIALRDQGRQDEAAGNFRHVLHLQPRHPGALGHLGMALRQQGRLTEARDCLTAAARLSQTGWVLHELGLTQLALGEDTTAEESFRAAIRLQPDLIDSGTQLAILMRKAGRYEEALALLEPVVQIKGDATASNLLGHLHLEAGPFEGRVERSLSALRQACDLAPLPVPGALPRCRHCSRPVPVQRLRHHLRCTLDGGPGDRAGGRRLRFPPGRQLARDRRPG